MLLSMRPGESGASENAEADACSVLLRPMPVRDWSRADASPGIVRRLLVRNLLQRLVVAPLDFHIADALHRHRRFIARRQGEAIIVGVVGQARGDGRDLGAGE